MRRAVPYWKLSSFYFFYFASLGVLVPYWGLYLKSLHFSSIQIGFLVAILPATKIIAPFIWGHISDLSQKPLQIIRLSTVLALLSFLLIFVTPFFSNLLIENNHFYWIAGIMFLFSFFWNACLPLFEALTLNHLGENSHYYSNVRLWGSLGFIVLVMLVGKLLHSYTVQLIPIAILISFTLIALTSFIIPEKKVVIISTNSAIFSLIKQPKIIAFLLLSFLMLFSHGPYYTFYTIHLQAQGFSSQLIGLLWAVGVIAEVLIFLVMNKILPKFGAQKLLITSLLLTSLRWWLIAHYSDSLSILLMAQTLHAFSFGLFHSVSISLVHQYFTGAHQARGQALYASVSFGAGVAVGSFVSGLVWDNWGASWLFLLASACTLIATALVFKYIPNDKIVT